MYPTRLTLLVKLPTLQLQHVNFGVQLAWGFILFYFFIIFVPCLLQDNRPSPNVVYSKLKHSYYKNILNILLQKKPGHYMSLIVKATNKNNTAALITVKAAK